MSEQTIHLALQAAILTLPDFAPDDVTLNDWRLVDRPALNAPYVVIEDADDFEVQLSASLGGLLRTYGVRFTLIERFDDWHASYAALRERRDAIADAIFAHIPAEMHLDGVRADSPIGEIYDRYTDPDDQTDALPIFIAQRFVATVREMT